MIKIYLNLQDFKGTLIYGTTESRVFIVRKKSPWIMSHVSQSLTKEPCIKPELITQGQKSRIPSYLYFTLTTITMLLPL